jgi:hypothetical protein
LVNVANIFFNVLRKEWRGALCARKLDFYCQSRST